MNCYSDFYLICIFCFVAFATAIYFTISESQDKEKTKKTKVVKNKVRYKLLKPKRLYRIAKHNGYFFAQYRFMFMWFDLEINYANGMAFPKGHYTMDEARDAIRRDRENRRKPVIVWEGDNENI